MQIGQFSHDFHTIIEIFFMQLGGSGIEWDAVWICSIIVALPSRDHCATMACCTIVAQP